jgi:hypothetical protein
MTRSKAGDSRQQLQRALDQLTSALRILDNLGAPGDIGSHLDLAIARLGDWLNLDHQPAASVELLLSRLGAEAHANDDGLMEPSGARDIRPAS